MSRGQAFFEESPKELIDEVWQLVDRTYVDATFNQTDWVAIREDYLGRSYSSREEAYDAIREMLEQLNDPYTRFMDPTEFRDMQIDTSGELTGVGIQITQDEDSEDIVVVSPIEGTPASEAGILSQDVIVGIDGQSTEGMDTSDAVSLIRGPVGSSVTLTIRRGDEEIDFELERARIEIHPVRYSLQQSPAGPIGFIRLNQFSANADDEMEEAIETLEDDGVQGFILDLRSNPGGLLDASISIARMWLDEGLIVSTVDRQGISDAQSANGTALTDLPVVILVDGGSASASEILSGALQDNDRAVIVGTQTFGKGLVQSVRGLGDGSGIAITVAKYLTPDGRDINQEGITPDIEIELTEEQRETLSNADPQYVEAVDALVEIIAQEDPQPTAITVP